MDRETQLMRLLKQAGYPAFKLDPYGFPMPGQVVKCFRERMTYQDIDGKEKHWTQADLGKRLGVKEWAVRIMETKGKGLDSIERRRTLATLLRIPPVLLGLGSVDSLTEFLEKKDLKVSNLSSNALVGDEQLDLYTHAFHIYNERHTQHSLADSIHELDQWIWRITNDVQVASNSTKSQLLRILFDFHILVAKIYGNGLFNWGAAFHHIDSSVEVATELKSPELNMMSLYLSGDFRLIMHKPVLAIKDFNNALIYNGKTQTTGAVYSSLALATAMHSPDTDAVPIQKLLDKAEHYTSISPENVVIRYNTGRYLVDRSDALILLRRFNTALNTLDDAEDELGEDETRRLEYVNILRTECYLKKKKPEYEQAVLLMSDILENNKRFRHAYHIQYIDRLYKLLQESPYANAPDVADLGILLRELRLKN